MKLEKKHWYWIAGVTILAASAIGGTIYLKRNKKKAEEVAKKKAELEGENKQLTPTGIFPLKFSSQGYEVKVIQKYMNSTCPSSLKGVNVFPLDVDGDWGSSTDKAAISCVAIGGNSIDKAKYDIIFRDMSVGNMLPN